MHECMDKPEDAVSATICSGIQGCGGLGSVIYAFSFRPLVNSH
jgi:hypothetical protein